MFRNSVKFFFLAEGCLIETKQICNTSSPATSLTLCIMIEAAYNLVLFLLHQILRDIGVRTMRLMTNNPAKFTGLKGYGLAVIGTVPVLTPITEENKRYLETKRTKMGHVYGSDLQGPLAGFMNQNVNDNDITDIES